MEIHGYRWQRVHDYQTSMGRLGYSDCTASVTFATIVIITVTTIAEWPVISGYSFAVGCLHCLRMKYAFV